MKKSYILILAIFLCGCSFQTYYPQSGSIVYEPVAPESVAIHVGDIEQDYVIIGAIAVDAIGRGEKTKTLLKEKAASLGANAVIKTELTKVGSAYARTGISGIAVRLK